MQRDSWMRQQMVRFAASRPGGWLYVHAFPHVDRTLLRASGGRVSLSAGEPVLLLTTTGARSGQQRETPLLYGTDGDDLVIVASKAGADHHPAWLHNLRKHPRVHVVAPQRTGRYTAHEAEGAERERLWAQSAQLYAGYEAYQQRAGRRRIPVVVLRPAT